MNRTLKFRCWDKKLNRWFPGGYGFCLLGEALVIGGLFSRLSLKRWDDMQIMQFTGLLDKQGKEIYEGDIVSFKHFGKPNTGRLAVEWDDNTGFFPFTECSYAWLGYECGNDFERDTMEVIGNIYEHPNLLDSTKDSENDASSKE